MNDKRITINASFHGCIENIVDYEKSIRLRIIPKWIENKEVVVDAENIRI
jgi:hypothetical protein